MPRGGLIVPPPPSRYQEPLEAGAGDEAAVSRRPECENCGATALAGSSPADDPQLLLLPPPPPRPLLRCSRCRAARFCSRACQRASWPFHRAHCRRNDFADAAEARGEAKFAAFLRGHGRLAQLRDAEVERLEAASAPLPGGGAAGGAGVGRGSWRGMSREEVMDAMYGRAMPLPRAPTWEVGGVAGGGGGKEQERGGAAAASAIAASAAAPSSFADPRIWWAKAAELDVSPGTGVAGTQYAWTQNLSHVEAAVRLPRECVEARRRRAAKRWRLKAAAAEDEEEDEEGPEEEEEERLRQPRLGGLAGRDVRVDLTATALRVAIVDGRGDGGGGGGAARPAAAAGGGGNADDDEVLLCGELEAAVKASECTWYIDDDAGVVRLSLLKRCRRGHYDAVAPSSAAGGQAAGGGGGGAAAGAASSRQRTNADTFWRGLLRGAPASMRLPEGPPPVAYYACAYEADD